LLEADSRIRNPPAQPLSVSVPGTGQPVSSEPSWSLAPRQTLPPAAVNFTALGLIQSLAYCPIFRDHRRVPEKLGTA
jgi:hypothetical protein